MNKTLLITFAGTGLAMCSYGIAQLIKGEGGSGGCIAKNQFSDEVRERISLEEEAVLWNGTEIPLETVAKIYRAPEVTQEEPLDEERPQFENLLVEQFFSELIEKRGTIRGPRRAVIIRLLLLLDKHGNCKSVVNNPKLYDPENELQKGHSYALLSKITLTEHVLAVARKFITKIPSDILIADALIVSLAHDIGKIPMYHEKGYSTGDHTVVSSLVLNGWPEFTGLPNHKDLSTIIKEHHSMSPPDVMTSMLKDADMDTRREELSRMINADVDETAEPIIELEEVVTDSKEKEGAVPLKPAKPRKSKTVKQPDQSAKPENNEHTEKQPDLFNVQPAPDPALPATDHPLGYTAVNKNKGYRPKEVDINNWFDTQKLLGVIRNRVNQYIEGRWEIASMPDGIVYCSLPGMWDALKASSPNTPALMAAEIDESAKRDIFFSVVKTLGDKGVVASDMLGAGFYAVQATIFTGSGSVLHTKTPPLYIPLKTEAAFNVLPSELEKEKSTAFRRVLKSIKPKVQSHDGKGSL